ncbi:phasin family protein [Chitinimonas sp.]|uniref:phasin family protein n=1 Tax=Chitinimonas sp. TaxID=1934313 RepID=UPI002F94F41A
MQAIALPSPQLPIKLIQAQLALWLKSSELWQESRERTLLLGMQALHRIITETQAEVDEVATAQDWQSLATLPAHAFRRCINAQLAEVQSVAEQLLAHQTELAQGCQLALGNWQRATSEACRQAGKPA